MNIPHKECTEVSSKSWCENIYPPISSHSFFNSMIWIVTHLVSSLCKSKCRIEASSWNGACTLQHSHKCESYSSSCKYSIRRLFSLVSDLYEYTQTEEERAPKFQQKDAHKPIVLGTTLNWPIRTQNCRLPKNYVSIDYPKISTTDLGCYCH